MENLSLPDLVSSYVQFTDYSVFLTGKAGTGKTTLLKNIAEQTHKRFAIVAPTGVAAINAGGVTIHSFFGLHPHTFIPTGSIPPNSAGKVENSFSLTRNLRISAEKIKVLKSLDLLVIDEISMVRCDLMDALDLILKKYRNNPEPFGGIQLLLIGDLYQLPPVVKDSEAQLLKTCYPGYFFFESKAIQNLPFKKIELTKIYRQDDPLFIELLNEVRNGVLSGSSLESLNSRFTDVNEPVEGRITLTTHVSKAEKINVERLARLQGKERVFTAAIDGEFNEMAYPADLELRLKIGAQVMFIKNDRAKRFFNGKIGVVESYDSETETISISCDDSEIIEVERESWRNVSYKYDEKTNALREEQKGEFSQFPIRLAWAITIHKSQGLTFTNVLIDAAFAFSSGQIYVALSRCRSLKGIQLLSKLSSSELYPDQAICRFYETFETPAESALKLPSEQIAYLDRILKRAFNFQWLKYTIRQAQESMISSLKKLDDPLVEKIKNWDTVNANLIQVSNQYKKHLDQLIDQLKTGEDSLGQTERFGKAVNWFTNELVENYGKPVKAIIQILGSEKGTKAAITELNIVELNFRNAIRRLTEGEILLQNWLIPIANVGIKQALVDRLSEIYDLLYTPNLPTPKQPASNQKRTRFSSKEKPKPGATRELTLEHFQAGKTIHEIALIRELTPGTISSHLSRLIGQGTISLEQVVPKERIETIFEALKTRPNDSFGQQLMRLRKQFDEHEINLVYSALFRAEKAPKEAV